MHLVNVVLAAAALLFFLYQAVMVFSQIQGAIHHYSNHLVGLLLITGLAAIRQRLEQPDSSRIALVILLLLTILATALAGWIRFNAVRLELASPFFATSDLVLGVAFIVSLLGLTWFIWGSMVAITVILFVLYFYCGHLIPGALGHFPYSFQEVTGALVLSMNKGVFMTAPLSADNLFFLLVFGALLGSVGLNHFFFEVGKAVGNVLRGGVAYTAVIGSALIAMVTGMGLTNAAIIGPTAIEPMKRAGFKPHIPAAIVATAAQGGQVAPPIMGVAAFLMAAFIGVDYIEIALRAVIPAFLFYLAIGLGVFFLTRTQAIRIEPQAVDWNRVARVSPTFFIPLGVMVLLLIERYSVMYAGFFAMAAILVLAGFQGRFRPSLKQVWDGLMDGVILAAQIGLICVAIGPIAQAAITTNLGSSLTDLVIDSFIGKNLLLALIAFTIVNILLGTGMPTLAAYVVLAITVVPVLQDLGLSAIAAHFFVFYYAALADITPPIALTINLTAKMADAEFGKTAIEAMKLSLVAFIIPFVFVFNPQLLDFPNLSIDLFAATAMAIASTFALSVALYGYFLHRLNTWKRALFGIAAISGFLYVASSQSVLLAVFLGSLTMGLVWSWMQSRPRTASSSLS